MHGFPEMCQTKNSTAGQCYLICIMLDRPSITNRLICIIRKKDCIYKEHTKQMKKQLLIFLFIITPKSLLSRAFGALTRIPLPRWILQPVINRYSKAYGVKTDEYITPEKGFRNFNSFFTRQLKGGVHTIDSDVNAVVSPVDARLDQFGELDGETIMQAKGIHYSLKDLLPSKEAARFESGSFMTLYLSPGDYHRIHSPASGTISGYFYIPGKLYTVQEFMVQGLKGLFSKNERLISYIDTGRGTIAVCKIGAMNVGRMSISHAPVITNKTFRSKKEVLYDIDAQPSIKSGDELGIFHLGSTIILLFEKNFVRYTGLTTGDTVRVGQKIGDIIR